MKKQLKKNVAQPKLQYFGHTHGEGKCGRGNWRIEEAVTGTRHQGTPRINWTNKLLEWSGRTYVVGLLQALAQDRNTW